MNLMLWWAVPGDKLAAKTMQNPLQSNVCFHGVPFVQKGEPKPTKILVSILRMY